MAYESRLDRVGPPDLGFEKEVKIDTSSVSDQGSFTSISGERARWTPLTRMLMSGEMTGEAPRDLTWMEKLDRWYENTVQGHKTHTDGDTGW